MLHDDRELFEQVVLKTSEELGIEPSIVEKDYYVTLFLKMITKKQPDIIFKGGTSLSKCYRLINRFSEDIDLNIESTGHPTEGQRRHLKESIVSVIEQFCFTLTNPDDIRSRRDYNRYVVDYPSVFGAGYLKQSLIVETSVYIRAYPSVKLSASSFIYEYLSSQNMEFLIAEHDLAPFMLNVQKAERTFIDKIFAVGDYYLDGKVSEHSRHLYDLYKLLNIIQIDSDLAALMKDVREERKHHKTCLSAQDGVDLQSLLREIIRKDVYKKDFEEITSSLLFEKVDYKTVIEALGVIAGSNLFD